MSTLMKTILGTVALTYCVSAHAKPFTNEDAISWAKNYNFVCGKHSKAECENDRGLFLKEYQNAYAGDFTAQGNVAFNIWRYRDRNDVSSQIEACAWQTIVVMSNSKYKDGTEHDNLEMMCKAVDGPQASLAYDAVPTVRERVAEIKKIIDAHTVHPVDIEGLDFVVKRDHNEHHAGKGWSTRYFY
ncbi:hypothetical protein [Aristophania vespae]|uniref:hypothetical protein n=1 Tax=Aristophania vespae TaxID=2697033 RepID=UPI0023514CA0|nr:hypothetical protein [Aristophania vespae]UMM63809.1 hypothetical protein DM15PD_07860 [Aristophania vespae]